MPDFFKPLIRTANWIKTRNQESADPPCALASCSGPHSLWQRFRKRRRPSELSSRASSIAAAMPGNCFDRPAFSLAYPGSVAAAAPPHSPRPPHGGSRQATTSKCAPPSKPSAAPVRKNRRLDRKTRFASEQEVTTALALQWDAPWPRPSIPPHSEPGQHSAAILEAFQMLPINYVASTNTLYLAFGERVDHAALYAIERVLDCRTQPCVAGRKRIAHQLDAMRQLPRPSDAEFGP